MRQEKVKVNTKGKDANLLKMRELSTENYDEVSSDNNLLLELGSSCSSIKVQND